MCHLGFFFSPIKLSVWFTNWLLSQKRKERQKEEAGQSRLVGGRFNKQGNLHMRLVLGDHRQVDLCIHVPESFKFIQTS